MTNETPNLRWRWRPTPGIRRIIAAVPRGHALDLGAGCGGNSILLAKQGFRVIAVDKSSVSVACLKRRMKGRKYARRIQLRAIDLSRKNWPTRKFRVILGLNVLHFLPSRRGVALVNHMSRSLLPGGVIVLRVLGSTHPTTRRYCPTPNNLRTQIRGLQILALRESRIEDHHPPLGRHYHRVIDLIAQRPSSKKIKKRKIYS